jgi:hypothetical protein
MAEVESKAVRISEQFGLDIESLYIYGEEVFGAIAAKSLSLIFIAGFGHWTGCTCFMWNADICPRKIRSIAISF